MSTSLAGTCRERGRRYHSHISAKPAERPSSEDIKGIVSAYVDPTHSDQKNETVGKGPGRGGCMEAEISRENGSDSGMP
jgi:hypothetical protein